MNSIINSNYSTFFDCKSFNINKIGQYVIKLTKLVLYLICFMLYWLSLIGTAHGIYNLLKSRDLTKQVAAEMIGKNRCRALRQAIESCPLAPLVSSTNPLEKELIQIRTLALQDPKKGYHRYSIMLQNRIEAALLLPEYATLKNDPQNPSVRFLHFANDALLNKTQAGDALKYYGKEIIKKYELLHGEVTTIAPLLDFAVYENFKGHRYDSWADKIFWGLAHPWRLFEKIFVSDKKEYNPCSHGNSFYQYHTLQLGNVAVETSLGPTIAGGNRLSVNLRHMANEKEGIRFEHTLEHLLRKGEGKRRKKLLAMKEQYPEQMVVVGGSLDGNIWKGRADFEDIRTSEEFHTKLKKQLLAQDPDGRYAYERVHSDARADSGFYFPNLTADELSLLMVHSQRVFTELQNSSAYKDLMKLGKEGEKRYLKAMTLNLNVLLFLKSLLKEAKKMAIRSHEKATIYLHQACKGCLDRGVITNLLSAYYEDQLLERKKIDGDYLRKMGAESVGLILFRALSSNGRLIIKDRYEALSDLLHLIEGARIPFFETLREPFLEEILFFQDRGGISRT